jgi:hypothetical protein
MCRSGIDSVSWPVLTGYGGVRSSIGHYEGIPAGQGMNELVITNYIDMAYEYL